MFLALGDTFLPTTRALPFVGVCPRLAAAMLLLLARCGVFLLNLFCPYLLFFSADVAGPWGQFCPLG